jgi:hypothetical protein
MNQTAGHCLDCQVSWALSYFDLPSGSEPIESGCKGPGRVAEAAHPQDQWSIHRPEQIHSDGEDGVLTVLYSLPGAFQ